MLKNSQIKLSVISAVLGAVLIMTGFIYAVRKPLWNDELYSQVGGIQAKSYVQILVGEIDEGNNSPLFYLVQKFITQVVSFRFPLDWKGEVFVEDHRSQIILRIGSNLFMTMAAVSLFYFFARYVSLAFGLYAFLLFLSSYTVWVYWSEARPYALWILLTTWQSLLFVRLCFYGKNSARVFNGLMGVHVLLALTTVMSTISIAAFSLLTWLIKEKEWKKFIPLTFIPLAICSFYFLRAPKYLWRVPQSLYQLLYPCFSEDQWIIWGAYFLALAVFFIGRWAKMPWSSDLKIEKKGVWELLGMTLMIFAVSVIYQIFRARQPQGMAGFEIVTRYFIFLVPVGIIATVLVAVDLLNATVNHRWLKVNIIIGLAGLLILRFLKSDPIWMWFEYFTSHVR